MRISLVVAVTLALTLIGTAAMAQDGINNTWIGMTGLVVTPSADTPAEGELLASFNWIDTDGDSTEIWSGIFGLTPKFEVGLARIANGDSETVGNLKYSLDLSELTGKATTTDVAVGVWDLGDDIDQALYLVLTDNFQAEQMGTARWNLGLASSDGDMLDGLFAGVELPVSERGIVQLDYDSENLNAAYRQPLTDQVNLGVGLIDGDVAFNILYNTGF